MNGLRCLTRTLSIMTAVACLAGQNARVHAELPLLLEEDFQQGAARWEPFDPAVWRIEQMGDNAIFSQFTKSTKFMPPHRSPLLIALLKEPVVADFDLQVRVKSTHEDYGHRDVCLVFGYQDPAHFYYVHLGKQADEHANQIFVVDDAPRTKISTTSTDGTSWDDQWHVVRIVRRIADGSITVYFDDLENPVMTATDQRFRWGKIGLGSFDDTSAWDDLKLHGVPHK